MQVEAEVLFVEEQAVCAVSLEVVPDLFDGIEFRRIAREPLDVQAWVLPSDFFDDGSLVDLCLIPQQDYLSSEMTQ